MGRILLLVLFCCVTALITIWAIKTGGTVSFHGEGWNFQVSLWAFVTSFLSGAGLLWIGVAFLLWIIKSPLRVFSWLRTRTTKDKTADFLFSLEFLNQGILSPVKKHMPYKNPLIQAYLALKVACLEKQWTQAEKVLKNIETQAPLFARWGYMVLEKAKGDNAMALRYGLDVYQEGGPVSFNELLDYAEKSQRLTELKPYLEEAYKKAPSWQILRYLIPKWEQQGHTRKLLKHLYESWKNNQSLDIFQEICRLENIKAPLERAHLIKKLQSDQRLSLEGYQTRYQVFLDAALWGEAEEVQKQITLLTSPS